MIAKSRDLKLEATTLKRLEDDLINDLIESTINTDLHNQVKAIFAYHLGEEGLKKTPPTCC